MGERKKHLIGLDKGYPRVGNLVHYHILEQKIKKADISRALDIIPTSLNDYFKKDTLQFAILWKLSHAMKHNFLAQLGEFLPYHFETESETALKKELAEKNERIKKMEIQLEAFREMIRK